jgi:hypothetical protein
MKDVQATEEASNLALKTENPALQTMKYLHLFSFSWVFLASWIWIKRTKINADPDLQHWCIVYLKFPYNGREYCVHDESGGCQCVLV